MFRIEPQAPPTAYTTYTIAIPLATHWRPATCAEVDCPHWLNGWQTLIDEATELGERQAHYIRHDRSRRHFGERTPEGLTSFTFPAGQRCFAAGTHRIQNGRPERFIQRSGDHRGNPDGRVIEHSVTGWVDSFGEHQERLAEARRRG